VPASYLHAFEICAIAAREERRLATDREEWGLAIRWGMEEAGWRAAFAELEAERWRTALTEIAEFPTLPDHACPREPCPGRREYCGGNVAFCALR
jgi:hypothetical protein